ncbi:hypothetical protein QNI16_20370 [Cytophagaceae bacterium YF14B1]|uniref:Uncharacterized protein n=1 Tax=Xanthocytophaga flava TaxID=3048013 RepID=A0AAE3UA25_9BACT|nr:hypothetical protein [Xanthocytophaga flavus]MDJ1482868.1 hypothetical protein [Xanthocytophaga flavus]
MKHKLPAIESKANTHYKSILSTTLIKNTSMSELSSLLAKISITQENLNKFLAAPVATFERQPGWKEWWDSREMYGKSEFTTDLLDAYNEESTNQGIVTDWIEYKPSVTHSEYNPHTQTWYFSIFQFSENYQEMIPVLGFLRSIETYKNLDDSDFVIVYPFVWGDDTVQAYIRFKDNESYFADKTDQQHQRLASLYLDKIWKDLETKYNNEPD